MLFELMQVIVLSLGSIFTLFILTKLMGAKEMSQLSMFDYINSITIGSIAAEMATELEEDFWHPLTAMIVYGLVIILVSFFNNKSIKFRRFSTGIPLILYNNNIFYKENFKKSKLDINDFLTQSRINGFFNLSDIQTAILEPNGKISFLPCSNNRPATPQDLNINLPKETYLINIILDGKVLIKNLESTNHDLLWLNSQIKKQKIPDISDIFIATYDNNDNLSIYLKNNKKTVNSKFE